MDIRKKTLTIFCLVLIALTLLPILGSGRHTAEPQTLLASVNCAGSDSGNDFSEATSISADGRFVAFQSLASDLVANDTNGTLDVFVRDLKTGTTTLVSVNSAGDGSANSLSFSPVVSADGRFVAFTSFASDLAPDDTNDTYDVFVRDLKTGTTTLVSVNSAGNGSGNGLSFVSCISANGRFVAFISLASDLADNDTNGDQDVFVRDLKTGTTTLVSVNRAGTASGNGFSEFPVMSADGRFVAFESVADDLVANDANRSVDVFVRDLKTGKTTLASVNSTGSGSGNSLSFNPVISADGHCVAFVSFASDLVANDTNGTFNNVFVCDLKTGKTTLASVNSTGNAGGNSFSFNPAISADGRFVAFQSLASDLVANDTNGHLEDVFVHDVKSGATTLVSTDMAGNGSGNGGSGFPVISADGRFVAFESDASDLVANDSDQGGGLGTLDVFMSDLKTGTTTLVSVNSAGTDSGNAVSGFPIISADGRVVAFESFARDLVANDTNSSSDVFVRRMGRGKAFAEDERQ